MSSEPLHPAGSSEPATILVVDDHEAGRYVTRRILERGGYRILEAATGQQALDQAAQLPHMIVLDVKLPDFSGFEVCRRLRADQATAGIPVLHLSATFQDQDSMITGLEGGAEGYLTQPVEPQVLLAYVRALVRVNQTHRSLQQSEQRFRSLFDSVGDGLLLADPESRRFRMANQAICDMLGYTRDELTKLWITDIHPPDMAYPANATIEDMAAGKVSLIPGAAARRRDGSTIHVDISNTLLTIDGRAMVLGSFRDVTQRRALETRLAQSDRLASVGLLASGVAHELNNPLAHVLLDLDAVGEELRQARDAGLTLQGDALEALLSKVEASQHSAQRIRGIVANLGSFSGTESPDHVPVQLRDLLTAVATMVSHELEPRARLELDLAAPQHVTGNRGRLSQAFLNLLVRATRSIDEGSPERNRVSVRSYLHEGACRVEIRDTGRGIDPDQLARLFDPFATTTQPGDDTGLGLAISHRIVEEHGGHILVASTPGQGSCFTVVLPCQGRCTPPEPAAPQPAAPAPARPIRLLIIDDEPYLRRAMQRLLTRAGFLVVSADSGREAQRVLADDEDFDVILCDLMMPELNGMELHSWLVQTKPRLARRLLFLTGGAFTPDAERYLAAAGNRVLSKPLPQPELIAAITQAVAARDER